MTPQVPFLPQALPADGTLRSRLASWVTSPDNLPFARATMNRLWAVVFGGPIITPVDDIPWGEELPEELEILAKDFIEHGYDLRRSLQILTRLRIFQLESQLVGSEVTRDHENLLAVFPQIRLRPEQVAGSLLQATSLSTLDATANVLNRVVNFGQQLDFVTRFGDFGKDEFIPRGETVTQRLLMLNGKLLRERLDGGLLAANKVSTVAPDLDKAVEVAYLCCLTRYPSAAETKQFVPLIEQTRGEYGKRLAIVDMYWALMNSAEFNWNH
ncbi:MAG: DUF1553 domain-containing protein [Pirellulaceae bacterium]